MVNVKIQITTQQMIQVVGSQKPPQAFTSLHENVSGFSKRICTGRRWNICSGDGFSQRQTICGTQTNFALVVFGNRWYNHFINARHL
nr:hypothetical protein [Blautia sp. OM05-6]